MAKIEKHGGEEAGKPRKARKVISISADDYRELRVFAAQEGITITEAFHRIMENSTVIVR